MQLQIQWSSELLMSIALLFGTVLLARFTWNRIKALPETERSLGRPLWMAVIGVFFLGASSLLNYSYAIGLGTLDTLYFVVSMVGAGFLAISAAMILGWTRGQLIPLALIGLGVAVAFLVPALGLPSFVTWSVVGVFALILFAVPFGLYSYLTYTSRRITSFAFALVLLTYPLFPVMSTFTDPGLLAFLLAIRLYGPSILVTAMILPDTKIGGELLSYGATITALFYFMSYLLITPIALDLSLYSRFIALAATLSIGTAVYSFTRWRQSRNPATITLAVYFLVGGISFLLVALGHTAFLPPGDLNMGYIALILGISAPMLLNLSSIVALDWNRLLLLPLVIFAAPLAMIAIYWPQGIQSSAMPGLAPVMAVTGILQSVIPLALYGMLWRRMRNADAPGRSRALFLMLGVLMLIFGTAGGNTAALFPSVSILAAFAIWWLGVTGRADILLKTNVVT